MEEDVAAGVVVVDVYLYLYDLCIVGYIDTRGVIHVSYKTLITSYISNCVLCLRMLIQRVCPVCGGS